MEIVVCFFQAGKTLHWSFGTYFICSKNVYVNSRVKQYQFRRFWDVPLSLYPKIEKKPDYNLHKMIRFNFCSFGRCIDCALRTLCQTHCPDSMRGHRLHNNHKILSRLSLNFVNFYKFCTMSNCVENRFI